MEHWITIAKLVKEIGLAAGSFALCAWMVVYIVKKLATAVDKLTSKFDIFMGRVKSEHDEFLERSKEQRDDHKEFAKQNQEITAALGRINGFKKD